MSRPHELETESENRPANGEETKVDGERAHLHRRRRMLPVSLMGGHTHSTTCGINIHIYQRDGKYLARGRYQKKAFGQTLGSDPAIAQSQLRHVLTNIENGTYLRPTEERQRPLKNVHAPQLSLRQVCGEFLSEKRKLRGSRTARNYQNRLAPVLDFAEQKNQLRRWVLAKDLDRQFVIELRGFLMNRQVTRNGRPGSLPRPMSTRQIIHCLETLRAAFAWAVRADVRRLPPEFVNPVAHDLIGPLPSKDPLRKVRIPLARRIELIEAMDSWQLLNISTLLVLPLRFEDVAGALISDVDFKRGTLRLGSRFSGSDFNKGRQTIEMPIPVELMPIFQTCADGRSEGPLFRKRIVSESRRKIQVAIASRSELEQLLHTRLADAPADAISTEQDRKQLFRHMLRELGGVSEDQIAKELKKLLSPDQGVRPYDIRGSVSQDMKDADLRHLELRYLTEHACDDIMNQYVSLDPVGEMRKYFMRIQPLLQTLTSRGQNLGVNIG